MSLTKKDSEIVSYENKKDTGHTYVQWLVTVLVGTVILNYGMLSGWVSPMKKVLQSETSPSGRPLTDNEVSWIASVIPLSACVGAFLYSYVADTYGRKVSIITMIFPQAFCWIIKLSLTHPTAIIIARILAGIPAGGCFNVVPMYVKEISQDNIRGTLVACVMTFTNIGLLAMYAMGAYLDYYMLLRIMVCMSVGAGILLLIVPESPAFLVKKGKIEDAAKTVAKLRGLDIDDQIVHKEMEYMKNQEEYFRTIEKITFKTIFQNKAWVRGFCFCMFLYTILNINGTLSMTTYAWTIMTNAGVTVNPELQTLSIPAIMIIGSLMSMICVEKFGRKPILVSAYFLGAASQACLASTLYLQSHSEVTVPAWIPVLAITSSTFSYSAGVVPMTYVFLSEIFNFQIRAKLIGVIITYAWAVVFFQLFSFQPITNNFGMYTTFYIFGAANLIGAVGCLIYQPETMGKTVEEIEIILLRK